MKRRLRPAYLILIIIIVLLAVLSRKVYWPSPSPETPAPSGPIQVTDGDTFTDSQGEKVRLLGIDTPERGDTLFTEAKVELQQLLASSKQIRYEFGPEKRDRYQRLLAFVYVDDTIFVNERLIEDGLAVAYFFPEQLSDATFQDLCAAQRNAIRERVGLWSIAPERPESLYFGNIKRRRFHRPSCSAVAEDSRHNFVTKPTREDFLNDCFAPCRNCKP